MNSEQVRNSQFVGNNTSNPILRQPAPNGSTEFIRESARKLSLWCTRTFRPIISHDELQTMMSKLGFVGLKPVKGPDGVWKEYECYKPGMSLRTPRLPYPRVDGCHIITYMLFLDSVQAPLVGMNNVADVFHVRAMPLHSLYDRNETWKRIEGDDEQSVFVYRHGTLDHPTDSFSMKDYQSYRLGADDEGVNSILIHKQGTSRTTGLCVPIKNITNS